MLESGEIRSPCFILIASKALWLPMTRSWVEWESKRGFGGQRIIRKLGTCKCHLILTWQINATISVILILFNLLPIFGTKPTTSSRGWIGVCVGSHSQLHCMIRFLISGRGKKALVPFCAALKLRGLGLLICPPFFFTVPFSPPSSLQFTN